MITKVASFKNYMKAPLSKGFCKKSKESLEDFRKEMVKDKDHELLFHPDANMRKTAIFSGLAKFLKVINKRLPKPFQGFISQIEQILNLIAEKFYTARSDKRVGESLKTYSS